jgi:hypothetical protein
MTELNCCSKCLSKSTCTDPEHCTAVAVDLAEMSDSDASECPDSDEGQEWLFIISFVDERHCVKGATEDEALAKLAKELDKKYPGIGWWVAKSKLVQE